MQNIPDSEILRFNWLWKPWDPKAREISYESHIHFGNEKPDAYKPEPSANRVCGANCFAVVANVALHYFDGEDTVIVINSQTFGDAISAAVTKNISGPRTVLLASGEIFSDALVAAVDSLFINCFAV